MAPRESEGQAGIRNADVGDVLIWSSCSTVHLSVHLSCSSVHLSISHLPQRQHTLFLKEAPLAALLGPAQFTLAERILM